VRALASGCAVVSCPAAGDMNENAARVDWAGLGTRLPRRLVTPLGVRLAVRRALESSRIRARVNEVAAWSASHDGAGRAAELVLALAEPQGGRARAGVDVGGVVLGDGEGLKP
jgi:UDP:flavonoid glycosyltransferase YjiC (YdhE family)